jgi:peptidoglycan/LPS O-acetylase OafA/YrhL
LTFKPSLQSLFGFGLFKVFFAYSSAETYNPPLWTMSYEFFGSFMVFIILASVRAWHPRTIVFAGLFLALTLWQSYFALFVGGILIADLFARLGVWPSANRCGAALCTCGVILGLSLAPWFSAVYIAVAMLLVAGVAFCGPIRVLFENRLSNFLGWMSYPLYLVQAPVVYAFSVNALHYLSSFGVADEPARWIVGLASVPVAILSAIAFCPVNDLAVRLSRKFGVGFVGLFARANQRLA